MRGMSPYRRAKLMALHYGAGVTACPAAGVMAPELTAGKLDEVAEAAWADMEARLPTLEALPSASPSDAEAWGILLRDCKFDCHLGAKMVIKTRDDTRRCEITVSEHQVE